MFPLLAVIAVAPAARLDAGLARGVAFLAAAQSADGAWRSDVYAAFRDGSALTPLAAAALQAADAAADRRRRAVRWLAELPAADRPYPVYTAALSVVVLSHPDGAGRRPARDRWREFLLARQLTEATGWSPADDHYGGWGYYPGVPTKPPPGGLIPAQQLLESNVSATAFAADALAAAGVRDPAVWRPVRRFLAGRRNPDGGSHFVAGDPVRNKAGGGAGDFRSYGSATADAARIAVLADAADPVEPPAAGPAVGWLVRHFDPVRHPGDYVRGHEPNRAAVYFYYALSAARTLRRAGVTRAAGRPWAPALAAALLARQRPDGSWANRLEQVRENDPLLATAAAVWALAECRSSAGP